jgi:hypothetical protein
MLDIPFRSATPLAASIRQKEVACPVGATGAMLLGMVWTSWNSAV